MNIEPLESRIAPASIISFTDLDGDRVTIRASVGILTASMLDLSAPGGPSQLYSLTLPAEFTGASINFTVARVPGGDGLVHVGKIDASAVDLFSVSVPGDLAVIAAGDADARVAALRTLNVLSMGTLGLSTQRASLSPTLESFIAGDLQRLQVDNDVRDAKLFVGGGIQTLSILGQLDGGRIVVDHDIGTMRIEDGIVGRTADDSGSVLAHGSIGTVTLHGPVLGGAGVDSGSIQADVNLRALNLVGSVVGGFGENSGRISAFGLLSFIKMRGDVRGGSGEDSGIIESPFNGMRDIAIAGSVIGGAGDFSGRVTSDIFGPFMPRTSHLLIGDVIGGAGEGSGTFNGSAARGEIRGSVIGGSGDYGGGAGGEYGTYKVTKDVIGGSGDHTGLVGGGNSVNKATIGGDVIGGSGNDSGGVGWAGMDSLTIAGDVRGGSVSGADSLNLSGFIFGFDVGKIIVRGSIISGSDSSTGDLSFSGAIDVNSAQVIEVRGDLVGNSTEPVTIRAFRADAMGYGFRRILIAGDVQYANLFGGAGISSHAPDSSIGTVQVNGNWSASNLVAGCGAGVDRLFGTADDANAVGMPATLAVIERVIIRGAITGTSDPGDHFGIVAQEIRSVTIRGAAIPLTAGPANNVVALIPTGTGDFTLREVAV